MHLEIEICRKKKRKSDTILKTLKLLNGAMIRVLGLIVGTSFILYIAKKLNFFKLNHTPKIIID